MTKIFPFSDHSFWTSDRLILAMGCVLALIVAFHSQIWPVIGAIVRWLVVRLKWLPLPNMKPSSSSRIRNFRPFVEVAGLRIHDLDRTAHTHIVGATGSGKTVLMEHLILSDIERGCGAIIIDAKGDRSFFDRLRLECERMGRGLDLHLLSATYPDESVIWNPCGLGDIAELQSKFHQAAIYSEPFYEKACEAAYLRAFTHLVNSRGDAGFGLQHLVAVMKDMTSEDRKQTRQGLLLDLENIANSEWSEVLGVKAHPGMSAREISLLEIVREAKILYVDLPTENKKVQSSRLGRLLLQEITTVSGILKSHPRLKPARMFPVFIDEFDVFATPPFAVFLNKGRSSNFAIHMAHQTLGDLELISPAFQKQILGNANIRFIFRQDIPDDAETWSRLFGTRLTTSSTWRSSQGVNTGEASNREVREFHVSPDEIKSLRVGNCITSIKQRSQLKRLKIPFTPPGTDPIVSRKIQRKISAEQDVSASYVPLQRMQPLSADTFIPSFDSRKTPRGSEVIDAVKFTSRKDTP